LYFFCSYSGALIRSPLFLGSYFPMMFETKDASLPPGQHCAAPSTNLPARTYRSQRTLPFPLPSPPSPLSLHDLKFISSWPCLTFRLVFSLSRPYPVAKKRASRWIQNFVFFLSFYRAGGTRVFLPPLDLPMSLSGWWMFQMRPAVGWGGGGSPPVSFSASGFSGR